MAFLWAETRESEEQSNVSTWWPQTSSCADTRARTLTEQMTDQFVTCNRYTNPTSYKIKRQYDWRNIHHFWLGANFLAMKNQTVTRPFPPDFGNIETIEVFRMGRKTSPPLSRVHVPGMAPSFDSDLHGYIGDVSLKAKTNINSRDLWKEH